MGNQARVVTVDMATLFVVHRGSLVDYANAILKDRAGAEDVVQEAWLRFSAAIDGDKLINPVGYLYRIVRNLALDGATRRSVEARRTAEAADLLPAQAPSAEQVLYFRDELRVLSAALAELPERTQAVFRMYRLEGCTLQVVAGHFGISIVRAHQLVKEALMHAAARLEESED